MLPGTTDRTHAHEREIPNVLLDDYTATLQHVGLIKAKRDKLETAQREAEQQLLHRVALDYRAGRIDIGDLAELQEAFRTASADRGFSTRWNAIVPETWVAVTGHARREGRGWFKPNGPGGTYVGPYPCPHTVPHPRLGTSVVYVLFDWQNIPCYVGSTGQLRIRMKSHEREGKRFTSWQAYLCEDRELAYELEHRLLREHKPYLNKKASR